MRKWIASLALLVAGGAWAQGLNPYPPGVKPKAKSGATVLWSAPFTTAGCLASGQTGGASSAISTTRASVATYVDANNAIQTCQADELRVAPLGAMVESARTNLVLYSGDLSNGAWTKSNTTISTDTTKSPTGATASKIVEAATTSQHEVRQNSFSTVYNTAYSWSVFVKPAERSIFALWFSGYKVITYDLPNNTVTVGTVGQGTPTGKIFDAGNGWYRVVYYVTAVRDGDNPGSGVTTSTSYTAYAGDTSKGIYAFGYQLEAGASESSYIATTSAQLERKADQVSATVPSVSGKNWCVATTAETYGQAWGSGNLLWALGSTGTLDKSSKLTVTDSGSGTKTVATASTPSTAGHRLISCASTAGALTLKLDSTLYDTNSGAGTGIIGGTVTTLNLGSSGSSLYSGTYQKNIKICAASSVADARTACQ